MISRGRSGVSGRGSGAAGSRLWREEGSVRLAERMRKASVSCRRVFSAEKARTTPASELRSVIAMAASPSSAARATSSSGWEAPVRKVKFEVTQSSA